MLQLAYIKKGGETVTRLKAKIQESGLMQVEVADKAGVSAVFISDLAAGRRTARPDTWERIAAAIGCSVEDIKEPVGEQA